MRVRVLFVDKTDGEGPWCVTVDGKTVIASLSGEDMDVSSAELRPLWDALGVELEFHWKGKR
jgi:hypothetical protein